MHSILVRLEHIMMMWTLIILLLPFILQLFISTALLDCKQPRDQPYPSTRLVPHLTYDLYHARGLGKVSVSPL
jgi:hypothetical protein